MACKVTFNSSKNAESSQLAVIMWSPCCSVGLSAFAMSMAETNMYLGYIIVLRFIIACMQSQSQQQPATKDASTVANGSAECGSQGAGGGGGAQPPGGDTKHMNGSVRRKCFKTVDHNGHCVQEHAQLQAKVLLSSE